ncbi:predicted protein [Postia placenta Mad-698-R]|nr:predicted protein [Postia placenta Mad-698-R]
MSVTKQAASPFNRPTADVILRSCDEVIFRVHKLILSEASSVFETLFTLPQPPPQETEDVDGLPVVHFTEDSQILDKLLRICYPVADPVFTDALQIIPVMEAAIKYEVEVARELCAKTLVQPNFLKSDPFTVFAIAYRFRLSHETRLIAKSALRFSELPKDFPVARIETFPAKALESCTALARTMRVWLTMNWKAYEDHFIPPVTAAIHMVTVILSTSTFIAMTFKGTYKTSSIMTTQMIPTQIHWSGRWFEWLQSNILVRIANTI